jgi:hypothetical protein
MSIYICFSDRSKKLQIFLSFCVMSLGSFDRSKNLQIFLSFCVMSLGSFDNIFDTGKIFLVQFNYYLFFFFFFLPVLLVFTEDNLKNTASCIGRHRVITQS